MMICHWLVIHLLITQEIFAQDRLDVAQQVKEREKVLNRLQEL